MSGKHIGYVRVSSHDQNSARQLDGIQLDKIFEDQASGKDTRRPALNSCLDYVRDGDVLHVHSIDRLARNLLDLLAIVTELKGKGVTLLFHKEKLEFIGKCENTKADPFQELQLHIIAAVAQFERALIKERQAEGIAVAKREGRYAKVGRKPSLGPEEVKQVQEALRLGEKVSAVARKFGVSRQTVYGCKGQ